MSSVPVRPDEIPVSEPAPATARARAPRQRCWVTARPLDVGSTWGTLRRGRGDLTWLVSGGSLWRGVRTPLGPVTLRVNVRPAHGAVQAHAWGAADATDWVLEHLPTMLGEDDSPAGFEPHHPALVAALRAHPGWRVPRTGLVMESLVPAVIEQKVTGQEAFASQRRLVRRYGERAPGPGAVLGLYVPPDPARLLVVPSWEWLRLGVSPQRADTLMRVLRVSDQLEGTVQLTLPQARRRLRALPGVGVWTAAETCQRALGDADAVSFGDYHVAKNVGWALTGQVVDDEGMAELLEPYAGHRYRVQRLLELSAGMRPRRGPRMAPRTHLPGR